jgi:IS30 family transposase
MKYRCSKRKYDANYADLKSKRNRQRERPLKFLKDPHFVDYVMQMIKEKYSPYEIVSLVDKQVINQNIKQTYRDKYQINNICSQSTIYRAFYDCRIQQLKPYQMLNEYRSKRSKYRQIGKRMNGKSIELRPREFDKQFGH